MRYLTLVSTVGCICFAMVFGSTGLCQAPGKDRTQRGEITDQIRQKRKLQIEQQLKRLRRQIEMLTLDEQIQDLNAEKRRLRFEQRKRQADEQAVLYALDQEVQALNQKRRMLQAQHSKRRKEDQAKMVALDRKIQDLNDKRRKAQVEQSKQVIEDQIQSLIRELEDLTRDNKSGQGTGATSDRSSADSR